MIRPSVGAMSMRMPVVVALLLLSWALPRGIEGQAYRYGAGWTVGRSYITRLNPDPRIALTEGGVIEPGAGFLAGIHLERAYGSVGRVVIRYQGTYQQPQMEWAAGERRIDAVSADIAALVRLSDPAALGRPLPYLMGGVGGIWYDLGRGPATAFPVADAYHDGSSRVLPLATFGIGLDAPTVWSWDDFPVRIRMEAADQMTFGSPLRRVSDGERYGRVHHLRLTVGAYTAVGLIR